MDLFEKAENYFTQKLPFVIYSKPNSDTISGIFQKDDTLYKCSDFSEKGFVFVSFDTKEKIILPSSQSEVLLEKKKFFSTEIKAIQHHFSENTKSAYEQLVNKTVAFIKEGNCQKVVVSRKEEVSPESIFSITIFQNLISLYPTAFNYCFYHPKVGLWLGATPEQLLKIEENQLKTVALAGTKTIAEQTENWGEKEQVEQQLVTDFIINNLNNFVDNLSVSKPYTHQAGSLLHIKTDISAKIKDRNQLKNILDILHPTPAVCGFPKEIAKKFIIENEGYNREFYAGFLGELNFSTENNITENSDLFVNLRCMKVENSVAQIFVGGGITADSNSEKEFLETVNKSETIKKVV